MAIKGTLAAIALATMAPNSTLWSDGIPPERFHRQVAVARVIFVPKNRIAATCHVQAPAGLGVVACSRPEKNLIIMPDPCPAADTDYYARIACHELGHLAGWPTTHGD